MSDNHIFKLGKTTYNFEEMIVTYDTPTFWRLKFNKSDNKLYRIAANSMKEQSPLATDAYLEYMIEKMLLEEE